MLSVLFSLCCCHVWCHTWMLCYSKSWNFSCFRLLRQPAVKCCNRSKSLNHPKKFLILETVEFNLDRDYLFLLDLFLFCVDHGSRWGFTAVTLVWIKLSSAQMGLVWKHSLLSLLTPWCAMLGWCHHVESDKVRACTSILCILHLHTFNASWLTELGLS